MPKVTAAVEPPRVSPPRGPSVFARLPGLLGRLGWRARWQLAPLGWGLIVWVVGVSWPAATACVLGPLGGAFARAARWPRESGRRRVSVRERWILATWCWSATVWALAHWAAGLPLPVSWKVLVGLLAGPSLAWAWGRRIRSTRRVDRDWRAVTEVQHVPHAWRGSRMDPTSVRSPGEGARSYEVEVGPDVHASDACTESARRWLERQKDLPLGTLTVRAVTSSRVEVTETPARHLSVPEGLPWQPKIERDGTVPIAQTADGRVASWRVHDGRGVFSGRIIGASGGGKSTTLAAIILPTVVARRQVIVYLDGGRGSSLPADHPLRPAMAHLCLTPDSWAAGIRAVHAVLEARQDRRTIDYFNVLAEDDPIVTLVIDEAANVARHLPPIAAAMVSYIAEAGRKVGVNVIVISQTPTIAGLPGGGLLRTNLTQIVAHGMTSGTDSHYAVPGSAQRIDLTSLPPEPGWAAVVSHRQVIFPARVRYASHEAIAEALDGFEPRRLEGADWDAARPHLDPDPGVAPEPDPTDAERAGAAELMLGLLAAHGPQQLRDIAPDGGGSPHKDGACGVAACPGWPYSRKWASQTLLGLQVEEAVTKNGYVYSVAGEE